MTTLLEFYNDKKDAYAKLRDAARSDFAEASKNLADAQKSYDEALAEYADLDKQAREKRKSLAKALMPADIETLAEELRELLDRSRNANADLLEAKELVAVSESEKARAAARMTQVEKDLEDSAEELAEAFERQVQHDSWNDTVDDGVLSDLRDQAAELADIIETGGVIDPEDPLADEKEIVAEAKARIAGDVPEKLLERALERSARIKALDKGAASLLSDLEDEAGKLWESADGLSGKVEKLWVEFLKAEEAYRDFVLLGQSRYEQALSLLKSVAKSPKLTDAEKNRINDGDLSSDGEAALPLEKACDDARAALDAKTFELELAIAKAKIEDIEADPEDNDDVKDIRAELAPLQTALSTAETNYTEAMQDDLDLWEASVPDHIWANVYSYDQALDLLAVLEDGDPAALKTAMDTAEASLVDALEQLDANIRAADCLEDIVDEWHDRNEYSRNNSRPRLISAIRGD